MEELGAVLGHELLDVVEAIRHGFCGLFLGTVFLGTVFLGIVDLGLGEGTGLLDALGGVIAVWA